MEDHIAKRHPEPEGFEKNERRCSLAEWYHNTRETHNLEDMAHYWVTHTCKTKHDKFLIVADDQKQQYFCKICPGNEEVQNEYRAHDILDPLNHPHIIKIAKRFIVDYTSDRGAYLTKLYKPFDKGVLKPFTKIIMRQLLEALSVVQANNIVHLDVKPDNIVWEWKENTPHIYLMDFGLASIPAEDEDVLVNACMAGTYMYMAPERYTLEEENLDKDMRVADIWSAGIVFGELLLGKPLFTGELSKESLEEFAQNIETCFVATDPLARDLLKHMLAPLTSRYTADQALLHPYFVQEHS